MSKIGRGQWDSNDIQDPDWRALLEQVCDNATQAETRARLTKRLLRDGNDLIACMLMAEWQARCPNRRWGVENFLDDFIGPLRARAARIARGPSTYEDGRDHSLALQVLTWNQRRRDFDILLRFAAPEWPNEDQRMTALEGIASLVPWLHAAQRSTLLEHAARWQGTRAQREENTLAFAVAELCSDNPPPRAKPPSEEDGEGEEGEDGERNEAQLDVATDNEELRSRAIALLERGARTVEIGEGGEGWLGWAAGVHPEAWLEQVEGLHESMKNGTPRGILGRGIEHARRRARTERDGATLVAMLAELTAEASVAELDAAVGRGARLDRDAVRIGLRGFLCLGTEAPVSVLRAALRIQYRHTLWDARYELPLRELLDHADGEVRSLARINLVRRAPWDIFVDSLAALGERLRTAELAEVRRILAEIAEYLWMPGLVLPVGLDHADRQVRLATLSALAPGSRIAASPTSAWPKDIDAQLAAAAEREADEEVLAGIASLRATISTARASDADAPQQ